MEIGVDQSAISRWRKGLPISLANAISLGRALDVSLDWLLTGRGSMEAHRAVASTSVDSAADILLAGLTVPEAVTLRRMLNTLSRAATRRARVSEI